MLDIYFRRPLVWDYCLAMVLTSLIKFLICKRVLDTPKSDNTFTVTSDLSTISLTLAGFILTFLTILISYKSTIKQKNPVERHEETESSYDLFFSSKLYFVTVKHLKNGIKSLVIISIIGYFLKLTLPIQDQEKLFLFSVFSITIIGLTIWRCILILSQIIKLQQEF